MKPRPVRSGLLRVVDGRLGSFSRGVADSPQPPLGIVSSAHLDAAAFFDALTGQQDRHTGNLLVDGSRLHLIDHGFTFAVTGNAFNMRAAPLPVRTSAGGHR